MTIPIFLFLASLLGNVQKQLQNNSPRPTYPQEFYVGTYTRGESEGIYKYVLEDNGQLKAIGLAARTENPSFLAKSHDGKFLLAVNETRDDSGGGGTVTSFLIQGNDLVEVDKKYSGGASPCFVNVNPSGLVLSANYGSGTVGLLRLDWEGKLTNPLDILQHQGSGVTSRQQGPHAHSAWFGKNLEVISVDLGTDELWFSQIDQGSFKFIASTPHKLAMEPGAGPRHIAFHPNGELAYVINELNSTVSSIKKNQQGNYEILESKSTLPTDYSGENSTADIHISPDGKFLYASNRGHNSIAIFQIDDESGKIILLKTVFSGGGWPRNFTISPDGNFLLVANQRSNNIISFKRNLLDGNLEKVGKIDAPSPVCLLF